MTKEELNKIIEKHEMWLQCQPEGKKANLKYADLECADLRREDLRRADLICVNLKYANLEGADLEGADLRRADLAYADLSGAKGLLSAIDYMNSNFEKTKEGYIVYKTFGAAYKPPENWIIEPGSVISENVNYHRTNNCGCGINAGTLDYIKSYNSENKEIYKLLIKFEWAAGIVVPYSTEGNIRCERAMILEKVKEE